MQKRVGQYTVEYESAREATEDRPSTSAVYRNVASLEGLPTTINGCSTMHEVFTKSVQHFGDRKCVFWCKGGGWERVRRARRRGLRRGVDKSEDERG